MASHMAGAPRSGGSAGGRTGNSRSGGADVRGVAVSRTGSPHARGSAGDRSASRATGSAARAARPTAASRLEEVERVKHAHQGPKPGRRVRRHGGLRRFLLVFFLVLVALGVVGGFAGYRLYRDVRSVQADAQKVLAVTDTLKQAVRDGDGSKVATVMNEVAAASSRMRATTHTTLWNVASYVPVYGEDVRMAQSLTATLDDLATNGLVPLGNGLAQVDLDNLIGDDGSIDVATMQAAVAALQAGAPAIHQANTEIQALPDAHIEKLGSMVDKAKDKFASIDEAVTTAEGIAPYIPQLFGANGQTATYLVTAQNTAEIRATGGYPGSIGIITITDGKMAIGDFSSIYNVFTDFDGSVLGITQEQIDAYDFWFRVSTPTSVGDASFSPDFPTAARVWQRAYESGHPGTSLTGVIGVNPVFLQNMMKLTGQTIEVDGMKVSGDNVGKVLMHDAYWQLPVDQQDLFFASVAKQIFGGMMGSLGKVGLSNLLQFVGDSGKSGNLHAWFVDDNLNQALSQLNLEGGIPDQDETKPKVGVYYNDMTFSKMGWYISVNTQVGEGVKNADGTTTYQLATTVKNNLGSDELASIPSYVSGNNDTKRDVGDAVYGLTLTVPAGGSIQNATGTTDQGGSLTFSQHAVDGHTLLKGSGNLDAGETLTVTYTVTVSANATEPLTVYSNPTAQGIAGWK